MTTKEPMPELKPCPFCGGEAYKHIASIRCKGCDVRFSTSILPEDSDMQAGWNNRTPAPDKIVIDRAQLEGMMMNENDYGYGEGENYAEGFNDCIRDLIAEQVKGE